MPAAPKPPAAEDLLMQVEHALRGTLEIHPDLPPRLLEACRHAVLGGGKRMRPQLCIRSAEAIGGSRLQALPAACAVELVHCFSLVHDDLPALDDDDLRRGQPTVHRAFDEATAILAGDYLLGIAMETLLRSGPRGGELAAELAAATNRMIIGQVWDTLGGTDPSLSPAAQLRQIHADKTGALITASCRLGAIAADADPGSLEALTRYGVAIGQMFQAVDDLLDETQTSEHLGKTAGKDLKAGKLTYPLVHGQEGTREAIRLLGSEAEAAVLPLGPRAAPLRALVASLSTRTC
jgi:geranylgeranyl pyrophosphate synthase